MHRPRPWRAVARYRGSYVAKDKDGRRNRYQIQAHLPLPETDSRERTIGEVLALLAGDGATGLPTREQGLAVTPADGGQTGISHG